MLAVDEEDDDALAASLREAVEPAMMQDSDRGLSVMDRQWSACSQRAKLEWQRHGIS